MGLFILASWLFVLGCFVYTVKIDRDSYKIIKEMAAEVNNLDKRIKELEKGIDGT